MPDIIPRAGAGSHAGDACLAQISATSTVRRPALLRTAASARISACRPDSPSGLRRAALVDGGDERRHLGVVGGHVALDEEVHQRRALEALPVGHLDGRLVDVLCPHHALGAVDLDPLVVPVARAARVGDLGDLAGRGDERDRRRIDVGHPADRLVDEHRTDRGDRRRLLAEQEARHVEVVDRHVAEQPAGARHVLERRRARVARRDRDHLDIADLPGVDAGPGGAEVGVESAVEADHQPRRSARRRRPGSAARARPTGRSASRRRSPCRRPPPVRSGRSACRWAW